MPETANRFGVISTDTVEEREAKKVDCVTLAVAGFVRSFSGAIPSAILSLIVDFAKNCTRGLWYSETAGKSYIVYDHSNDVILMKRRKRRVPKENCFKYGVYNQDINFPITGLDIGYSSCGLNDNLCPTCIIRKIYKVDIDTKESQIIDALITYNRGDDVVPVGLLHICDGVDEWINEVTVYSTLNSRCNDGAHLFLFKTNKGRMIQSYDEAMAQKDDVQPFEKCIESMKKEVIKPPSEEFKLSGMYGHHWVIIDTIGFVFSGPQYCL